MERALEELHTLAEDVEKQKKKYAGNFFRFVSYYFKELIKMKTVSQVAQITGVSIRTLQYYMESVLPNILPKHFNIILRITLLKIIKAFIKH